MIVNNIDCEPAVDIFVSADGERHILEITWWARDDYRRVLLVQRMDLTGADAAMLATGIARALGRLGERGDG